MIFDLDGVLRRWDPLIMSKAEATARLPSAALARAVLGDHDLLQKAVTGVISDGQWRAEITRRLGRAWSTQAAATAVTAWSQAAGEVDHATLELVRRVRARLPVALFSNATSRLTKDLEKLGLHREVDAVINSSELHLAKPDPEAFVAAAARLGRQPGECLMVDDTAANALGARAAGMFAHHYRGAATLSNLLMSAGMLDEQQE